MPGPVSDAYDPEFGTAENAERFLSDIKSVYAKVGGVIDAPPVHHTDLPYREPGHLLTGRLRERDWRYIRYALEALIQAEDPTP